MDEGVPVVGCGHPMAVESVGGRRDGRLIRLGATREKAQKRADY